MNSIPLIKGNTPQEINTSIIALKKALSELEAQDRLLQGTDKGVQDKIKQINELIEGINTHLTAIDSQITALQPVNTVTSGNMQSVTSNAVANTITPLGQILNQLYNINDLGWVWHLPFISWENLPSQSTDDNIYFKEWFDYLYNNSYFEHGYRVYIGLVNPNMTAMALGYTYGGTTAKLWSAFIYFHPNVGLRRFGYRNGVWYYETLIIG